MRALRYAFEEAFTSLWRGRQAGLLSTLTIALALFVLGGFLVVTANLERLGSEWSNAAELSVYLKDDITAAERSSVEAAVATGDLIAAHEYVSKADALARFKQTFGDLAAAVDGAGGNPLPASLEVRLKPGPGMSASVDTLGARLRQMPGVADVRYDRQWLTRVLSAINVIRGVGFVLGSVLAIAAALTVANVVRLALYARRDELDIMNLVGAPQAYVRGPFVMEGVLQGGIGALVALLALGAAFVAIRGRYLVPLASALNIPSIHFLPAELCVLLVAGGMAVGCLGGLVAAWNR
jgi:cell division transport system permease protein